MNLHHQTKLSSNVLSMTSTFPIDRIRLLLIDDDRRLAETVIDYLELNNIDCDYLDSATRASALLDQNEYDIVVTDISMPHITGLEFCSQIRSEGKVVPVLMLSALDKLDDKLQGFATGADDYLTKPFDLEELLARVRTLSQRRTGRVNVLKIDEFSLEVNVEKKEAYRENKKLKLTPTAFKLLVELIKAYPGPAKKTDLEYVIWGDSIPESGALKVHIHNLRCGLDKPFDEHLVHVISRHGVELCRQK